MENNALPEQAVPPASPYKGFWGKVDAFFGITAAGSDFKRETVAGLTTFMAMVYILMVNAGMFSEVPGLSYGAAYIATAIGAVAGTMLMAFLAKMPLAQASGMGINAFIVYTLILGGTGLSYANCMVSRSSTASSSSFSRPRASERRSSRPSPPASAMPFPSASGSSSPSSASKTPASS